MRIFYYEEWLGLNGGREQIRWNTTVPWIVDYCMKCESNEDDRKAKALFKQVLCGTGESFIQTIPYTDDPKARRERQRQELEMRRIARSSGTMAIRAGIEGFLSNPFLIDPKRPVVERLSTAPPAPEYPPELVLNWTDSNEEDEPLEVESEIIEKGLSQPGILEPMLFEILYYTREPSVLDQITSVFGSNIFRVIIGIR